ncbi:hypothetical protein G7K71_18840 [Desulfofundulus sp. TPOSR]|uniref:hypothetical protein n=1 Tax=Desulfofundulus sp. TPOSR TaxID=2714340 RepID=UPI0014075966|nr:hypothetical protein [Desulfofundulus sp. TPOSR]NHM26988.1 hypothetical protein [Desulfofundulus sp. TPOSR]NHM28981.1 hypothetical protein [Desulfofundulus sp. TPOSR]
MARNKTKYKRLELRLPADHPLFRYPPGQRAARARELIDTGIRLEERLLEIERQLAGIAQKLTGGACTSTRKAPKKTVEFDVEAFMNL